MVELDRVFEPIIKAVNECYEKLFPEFPSYPKFSLSRAMVTLWKSKVYAKAERKLLAAFVTRLKNERKETLQIGLQKTEYIGHNTK